MNVTAKCRVTCDYEKKSSSELNLKTGDIVDVLRKGNHIWYGRLNDVKGFFPSRIVEELPDQDHDDDKGNSLSATAVDDSKSTDTVACSEKTSVLMDTKILNEILNDFQPLEDKRRSRPKGTGRPPSQVFIKENILRSESMENLSAGSDDSQSEKEQEKTQTGPIKVTSVSQLVLELKQKPNLKTIVQKDTVSSSTIESSTEVPEWMKGLPKKKISVPGPIKKSENAGLVAPWMQEMQRRREHKLSLRGDEESLEKISQEIQTSEESGAKYKASHFKSETLTTSKEVSEENHNIQMKSFSTQSRQVTSTSNNLNTKVKSTHSVALGEATKKENIPKEDDSKTTKTSIKSDAAISTPKSTTSGSVSTEVTSLSHTTTSSSSTQKLQTDEVPKNKYGVTKSSKEAEVYALPSSVSHTNMNFNSSHKVEYVERQVIELPQEASVLNTKFAENVKRVEEAEYKPALFSSPQDVTISTSSLANQNSETKLEGKSQPQKPKVTVLDANKICTEKPINTKQVSSTEESTKMDTQYNSCDNKKKHTEIQKVKLPDNQTSESLCSQPNSSSKETRISSIKSLLAEIDIFDKNHKSRSLKIRKDIQNLERAVDQQYQEIKTFVETVKSKLSVLSEGKEH